MLSFWSAPSYWRKSRCGCFVSSLTRIALISYLSSTSWILKLVSESKYMAFWRESLWLVSNEEGVALLGGAGWTESAVNGRQVRQQEKDHSYETTHHFPDRQLPVKFVRYWAEQWMNEKPLLARKSLDVIYGTKWWQVNSIECCHRTNNKANML